MRQRSIIHDVVVVNQRQDSAISQAKSVSFDDNSAQPEQIITHDKIPELKPTAIAIAERPKLTARQKWLWAFNKICAQLNVSRSQNIQLSLIY